MATGTSRFICICWVRGDVATKFGDLLHERAGYMDNDRGTALYGFLTDGSHSLTILGIRRLAASSFFCSVRSSTLAFSARSCALLAAS